MSFPVLQALRDVGYETPSPIQAQTIPHLVAGEHVVGLAQTGTGKTAAFALPILTRLDLSVASPQALILAPTRELALQVSEAFGRYATHLKDVNVLPVYGGQGYGVQLSALRRGVHVVVGTPGRVMDHLEKGTLDLSGLRFLVLDEADEMLNMGFAEDVDTILAHTPDTKQVALFSATMPPAIRKLARNHAPGAQEITVAARTRTASSVEQQYLFVSHQRKLDAMTRVLEVENFEAMIVFVRTKQATEELAERLRARGFSAVAINGDVAQQQRERTIDQLRKGKIDILVATDVAARGLDVERISHVVNYDIPTDVEAYVHRIGRTGRAGRSGRSISFVTPREKGLLRAIEKHTRSKVDEIPMPSVDDVNATRVQRFTEAITQALGDDQMETFRELVATYEREHDVPAHDIAAAIAVLAQDGQPLLLEEQPEPPPTQRRDSASGLMRWRIAVGRKDRVEPRMIVGALANEGGLRRGDFGKIDIRGNFSLVELPDLTREQLDKLSDTRIAGVPIDIRPDDKPSPSARGGARGGPRSGGPKGGKPFKHDGARKGGKPPYDDRKPRHKKRDDR
ncbi:DEAD/DEAH box helicase [Alteromonas gracilis]